MYAKKQFDQIVTQRPEWLEGVGNIDIFQDPNPQHYFYAIYQRMFFLCELKVYPCSGVRASSVRPSVVHNFKDLLL